MDAAIEVARAVLAEPVSWYCLGVIYVLAIASLWTS